MNRLLTKNGYAVQVPSGEYRGVYRDRATANMIASLASVFELLIFDNPTVKPVRIPRWTRYGARTIPKAA